MEKKALLFFDVDGTLICEESQSIPQSAVNAIHMAQESGHLIFVNTGRPFSHIHPEVLAVGFDGYICSCGMQIRIGEKVVQDVHLTNQQCANIRDCARLCRVEMSYESDTGMFYDSTLPICSESAAERKRLASRGVLVSSKIDDANFRFEKFLAWKADAFNLERLLDYIADEFQIIDRAKFYECLPKGYSKAIAMSKVQQLLGLQGRKTYAFGDGPNDIEMLRAADVGIVMGNAPEHVKNKADFVTKRAEQGGIEYALRRLQLI